MRHDILNTADNEDESEPMKFRGMNVEPKDATRAFEQSVAWLRQCGLPETAARDDGFIQAIYQLECDLDEDPKIKARERELIRRRCMLARMIVLRYKNAKSLNWLPAACAMLFMVYQQFRDLELIVRGWHSLQSERKKTESKGRAPHEIVRKLWGSRRANHPEEGKDAARKALLAELRRQYPEQTLRGIEDATRDGSAGRPKGKEKK